MGTGVTPPPGPPESFTADRRGRFTKFRGSSALCRGNSSKSAKSPLVVRGFSAAKNFKVKPHDRLVQVSFTRHRASTPCLSTWWSTRGLQVVYTTGDLILGRVSRLDAFSVYLHRT